MLKREKSKESKKRKRVIIIMALIICFSMVFSIFAIYVDNNTNAGLNYGKQHFKLTDTGYATKINGKSISFYYFPSDLERINMSAEIAAKLRDARMIIFLFSPNESFDNLAYIDLIRFEMPEVLQKDSLFATTSYSKNYTLPILGCENATSYLPFVLINISSEIYFTLSQDNPDCIVMSGKLRDIVAARDRMLYSIYGIME